MATVLASPAAALQPVTALAFRPGRNRRDASVAFGLSVLLHLAMFAVLALLFHHRPAPPAEHFTVFHIDEPLLENDVAVGPLAFEPPAAEPTPAPASIPVSIPPLPPAGAPELPRAGEGGIGAGAGPGAGAPAAGGVLGGGGSVLERLSRGYRDPLLLSPADALPPEEITEAEWLRLRLANQLGIYNDSVAREVEARLRATDWTVKDKNGGRWGVSPGQIHLGNRTLPLPFGFSPPPGRRDELAGRMRSWEESQAQASRVEAAQTFQQRVKAIRARQEAARDSARRAGGGR